MITDRASRIARALGTLLGKRREVAATWLYGSVLTKSDPRDVDVAILLGGASDPLGRLAVAE